MKSLLLILNHAPHYREEFLRQLAEHFELTVAAGPCNEENLIPPKLRGNYSYIEFQSLKLKALKYIKNFSQIVNSSKWDIICCNLNLNYPQWIIYNRFRRNKSSTKWFWWGHILSKNESSIANFVLRSVLRNSDHTLTHSKTVNAEISKRLSYINVTSFNNTEVSQSEIFPLAPNHNETNEIRLLFVGRPQKRKKLERLVELARRVPNVIVRLVGPGMPTHLKIHTNHNSSDQNIELFEAATGPELRRHFQWCDIVANPGHVGLLAVTAGQHNRGILIDSESKHAPEFIAAKDADQPFINWDTPETVDAFITRLAKNRNLLIELGNKLQEVIKREYTIEQMVNIHCEIFNQNS